MRKIVPSSMRFKIFIAAIIVVALVGAGAIVFVRNYYEQNLRPVSQSQTAATVIIPSGATVHDIGVLLKEKNLIRNTRVFEQYVRNNNLQEKMQAGTYSLRPSQSVQDIVEILTQGKILSNLFTIVPGQRIDQIKSAMINAGFDADEVEAAFKPDMYKNHPALVDKPATASLEGYLYPESFQKTAETSPSTIVGQSLDEMQKYLTPSLRAALVQQGLTVHQGVILASIIEREVSHPEDRKTVAQVFLKRLREDKKLESDATASYGAILDGEEPSLTYESPYNTYLHEGLPPGPISNVSGTSLQAVAHPSNTDWLFFVSGDDGKTYFSRTLEEHEALVSQHCKELCGN